MTNNPPITKETEAKLFESTELLIDYVAKEIDKIRIYLKKIKYCQELSITHNTDFENDTINGVEMMLEYRMLIGILLLDLTSATRAHLKSKHLYEKLFSVRQIVVIINEGYKKIYNFVNPNDKGDSSTSARSKSFWCKDIRNIVDKSLPELTDEYSYLTQSLENYYNVNFESIKVQRDLFVHYDKSASKVYDVIIGLNVEETFLKLLPFLGILDEMFRFTEKMALITSSYEKNKISQGDRKFESTFENLIEIAKMLDNEEDVNKLISKINNSKTDILEQIKKYSYIDLSK